MQMSNYVRNLCFKSRDSVILFRAFTVYVRPILEYCASVWSPCYSTYISAIESVQRRFTKRLSGFYFLSYAERLHKLGIDSLEERRLKIDLAMMFKIVHNMVDIDNGLFVRSPGSMELRGNNFKLLKPHVNINCRAHSFACRNINIWNTLPQCAIDCNSIKAFKIQLDKFDFSKFLHLNK